MGTGGGYWIVSQPSARRSWERLRLLATVHNSTNEGSHFGRVLINNSLLLPFGVKGNECNHT